MYKGVWYFRHPDYYVYAATENENHGQGNRYEEKLSGMACGNLSTIDSKNIGTYSIKLYKNDDERDSILYANGQGVEQDYGKAAYWYEKAAKQGNVSAQFNLGVLYDKGQGVEQDYAKAAYWYEKAAEQGDVTAQFVLGTLYYKGQGVEQDYIKATYWFGKSAGQGNAKAQYNLAFCYEHGLGVTKNIARAKELYQKAADKL